MWPCLGLYIHPISVDFVAIDLQLKHCSRLPCAVGRPLQRRPRGDRQGQPGVERGCLRGDGAAPWTTTSTSRNLQRNTLNGGRCKVRGKKNKRKTLVQYEPRSGSGCHNNNFNESNLQRNTLNEGRCEVSGKKKKTKTLGSVNRVRAAAATTTTSTSRTSSATP
jgi:hypothetical protein